MANTIEQTILNLPLADQQDPAKWVEALRAMTKPDPGGSSTPVRMFTDDEISRALQIWVAEAGPKSWKDLLDLHQTSPNHVQAWLNVMDPTTKLRIAQEIEQIVQANTPTPPSGPPAPTEKDLPKAYRRVAEILRSSDPLDPGDVAHTTQVVMNFLKDFENHSKLNDPLPGTRGRETYLTAFKLQIRQNQNKIAPEEYRSIMKSLADMETFTESYIPYIPIGKNLYQQMKAK